MKYTEISSDSALIDKINEIQPFLISAIVLGYRRTWLLKISAALNERKIPVVFPYMSVPYRDVPYASIDYSRDELIRDFVFYFSGCGRKKIALYGIKPDSIVDLIKIQEFHSACRDAGCESSMSDIYYLSGSFDDTADLLINKISKYNAILCASDITAIHLMNRFHKNNINVPDDVFVSGMSNSIPGSMYKPSLTSSTMDFYDIGNVAVDAYYTLSREAGSTNMVIKYIQTGSIIIRESTNYIPLESGKYTSGNHSSSIITPNVFDGFYNDNSASTLLKVETLLQQSDKTDIGIINGLLSGTKRDEIADLLFISQSTYKYRLRRMKTISSVSKTSDLIDLLQSVLHK